MREVVGDWGKSSKFVAVVGIDEAEDGESKEVENVCKRKEPASLMTKTTGVPGKGEGDGEVGEE